MWWPLTAEVGVPSVWSSSIFVILAEVADIKCSKDLFLAFLFWREELAMEPFTSFTGPEREGGREGGRRGGEERGRKQE